MIVTYKARFEAGDMADAVSQATDRWRRLVGKSDAVLPWGATITITDLNGIKEVELNVSTDHADSSSS